MNDEMQVIKYLTERLEAVERRNRVNEIRASYYRKAAMEYAGRYSPLGGYELDEKIAKEIAEELKR